LIDIFHNINNTFLYTILLSLQHHTYTYTYTHMYICTYTICIIFLYARIHLHLYLHNTCIQNTHITLFCHVVVVVVFFIVVFIDMTILYTMIIVNSHLLHHFIPEPMIQELHIL